jgi:hypothetical protein
MYTSLWWLSSCRKDTNPGLHNNVECYVGLYIQLNDYSFEYSMLVSSVSNFSSLKYYKMGTPLSNCATSRKIVGSFTYAFQPHCGPAVDSASDRNEYQVYLLEGTGGQCVRLTTLPPSCVDCLDIWEP